MLNINLISLSDGLKNFFNKVNGWIDDVKTEGTVHANRLTKLVFERIITKQIEPIVTQQWKEEINEEGFLTVKVTTTNVTGQEERRITKITLAEEDEIGQEVFDEEKKEIEEFICNARDVLKVQLSFDILAYGANGKELGRLSMGVPISVSK